MNNAPQWSFSAMVPGFDFLQNLVKGASGGMGQMPHLASWVAPTIDVQELQKRIDDLKAVQFWLEQNGRALAATVQALEVQKMTLSALQGMNVGFADMVQNFQPAKSAPASSAAATPAKEPEPAKAAKDASGAGEQDALRAEAQAASMLDPMQWWGALTQQFQHIATQALQEMAAPAAQGAPAAVQEALQSAAGAASQVGQMAAQSWQGMQEAAQKMAQAAAGQKSPPAAGENAAASRKSATAKGAARKAAASAPAAAPARRTASKKASAPARKSAAGKSAR